MKRGAKSNAEKFSAALLILRKIHPLLAGAGADVQAVVLADLTATWVAGFPPADRLAVVERQGNLITELLAAHDAEKAQP